jgi:hypothetical protein
MIAEESLKNLCDFGQEKDGSFTDRWEFAIVPENHKHTEWSLYYDNEINGDLEFIKHLEDLEDLKETYYMLTFPKHELEFKTAE